MAVNSCVGFLCNNLDSFKTKNYPCYAECFYVLLHSSLFSFNLQHSSCEHAFQSEWKTVRILVRWLPIPVVSMFFSIRVENSEDLDQMASTEARRSESHNFSKKRIYLDSTGQGKINYQRLTCGNNV